MTRTIFAAIALLLVSAAPQDQTPNARPRASDLGLKVGVLPTGPLDAITDVAGVEANSDKPLTLYVDGRWAHHHHPGRRHPHRGDRHPAAFRQSFLRESCGCCFRGQRLRQACWFDPSGRTWRDRDP